MKKIRFPIHNKAKFAADILASAFFLSLIFLSGEKNIFMVLPAMVAGHILWKWGRWMLGFGIGREVPRMVWE